MVRLRAENAQPPTVRKWQPELEILSRQRHTSRQRHLEGSGRIRSLFRCTDRRWDARPDCRHARRPTGQLVAGEICLGSTEARLHRHARADGRIGGAPGGHRRTPRAQTTHTFDAGDNASHTNEQMITKAALAVQSAAIANEGPRGAPLAI